MKQGVRTLAQRDAYVHCRKLRVSVWVHFKVHHITSVGTIWVVLAVLLARWIKMSTSRFEVRSFALAECVDVKCMRARSKLGDIYINSHAGSGLCHDRCAYLLALRIDEIRASGRS